MKVVSLHSNISSLVTKSIGGLVNENVLYDTIYGSFITFFRLINREKISCLGVSILNEENISKLVNQLYRQYSDLIYRYIYLMIGDAKQAEDLVQETYIRAFKSLNSFNRKSSYKTWLYTIARNVTIDYSRKMRLRSWLTQPIDPNLPDSHPTPQDIVEYGETTEKLYKALMALKPNYREVIILRRIKGFSILETAQILQWSEAKVKSTMIRGLAVLKSKLGEEIYSETI